MKVILGSSCLRETVKSVLQSCDLSQDYVNSIAKTRTESDHMKNRANIFHEPVEIYRPIFRRRKPPKTEKTLVYELFVIIIER